MVVCCSSWVVDRSLCVVCWWFDVWFVFVGRCIVCGCCCLLSVFVRCCHLLCVVCGLMCVVCGVSFVRCALFSVVLSVVMLTCCALFGVWYVVVC